MSHGTSIKTRVSNESVSLTCIDMSVSTSEINGSYATAIENA